MAGFGDKFKINDAVQMKLDIVEPEEKPITQISIEQQIVYIKSWTLELVQMCNDILDQIKAEKDGKE